MPTFSFPSGKGFSLSKAHTVSILTTNISYTLCPTVLLQLLLFVPQACRVAVLRESMEPGAHWESVRSLGEQPSEGIKVVLVGLLNSQDSELLQEPVWLLNCFLIPCLESFTLAYSCTMGQVIYYSPPDSSDCPQNSILWHMIPSHFSILYLALSLSISYS